MTFTIKGDILTAGSILHDGYLTIEGGAIKEIGRRAPAGSIDLDRSGYLVAPGFIDAHVHGGGGADFMDGHTDAVRRVLQTHARHGSTSVLATTVTASAESTDRAIDAMVKVMDEPMAGEARILGIHLEGPYICPAKRGAQPAAPIRPVDANELRRWGAISGDRIRKITLAPEMPGAIEFIRIATEMGIVCSVGHTDATSLQTQAAIDAGATSATHLFNAMRGLHHREPGPLGPLLASPCITAELICDGAHLHPQIVSLAVALKSPARIQLITDAMSAADMPDGDYDLGNQKVVSAGGIVTLADGTLAGSTLTMERAFLNIQRFAGVDAASASRMASTVPAREIGAAARKGALEAGKDADIAIIDPQTGSIDTTIVEGFVAYRR